MPKKIDKKKQKVIKKKVVKKTVPKIVIYTQPLPRTKCCTDVEKTGEAFSIPYGFRDLAGTQRISQTLVPAKPMAQAKETISIQTQTDNQKFLETPVINRATVEQSSLEKDSSLPVAIQVGIPVPLKSRRTKNEMEEAKQMAKEDVTSLQLGLSKYNIPEGSGKKNRKNSISDLQERYFNLTGENMNLTKDFKAKQFQKLVEELESRKKKD
jgi:hypothetical protein